LVLRVADRPVMMFDFKAVQLEDQHATGDQALIYRPAVGALTAEQTLIPSTARFDVGHGDEGLRTHQHLRCDSARPPLDSPNAQAKLPGPPAKPSCRAKPNWPPRSASAVSSALLCGFVVNHPGNRFAGCARAK